MPEPNDTVLLERARAGDRQALEQLLAAYESTIYRFALQMCRQPQDAQGVLQETLIAMARTVRDFRGGSSLSTWLYSIARSFCVKKRRRRQGQPQHHEALDERAVELPAGGPSPEQTASDKQLDALLKDAIATLDPKYREVLVLRDVEGLTAPEVAEVTGVSVAAVKSRLHRSRRMLRDAVATGLGVARPESVTPPTTCPDVLDMYSRHLEGDLTAEVCGVMERHLDSCAACTDTCDSLKRTLAKCRTVPTTTVPADIQAAVRRALADEFGSA